MVVGDGEGEARQSDRFNARLKVQSERRATHTLSLKRGTRKRGEAGGTDGRQSLRLEPTRARGGGEGAAKEGGPKRLGRSRLSPGQKAQQRPRISKRAIKV